MTATIDHIEKINIMISEIEDVITQTDRDFKRFEVIKDGFRNESKLSNKDAKALNLIHERLAQ